MAPRSLEMGKKDAHTHDTLTHSGRGISKFINIRIKKIFLEQFMLLEQILLLSPLSYL